MLLVLAALSLRPVTAVQAHAVLLRSSPAPNARLSASPPEVDLFFSEALNRRYSTIDVRDQANVSVGARGLRFGSDPTEMDLALPLLKPGYYSVQWTTVSSVDGHRLEGSFPFVLLQPDGSLPAGAPVATVQSGSSGFPSVFDVVLRWLLLLGTIAAGGGLLFCGWVALPAAGSLAQQRAVAGGWAMRAGGRAAAGGAAVAALLNLEVLARQADAVGGPRQLGTILATRSGLYWGVREAVFVAIVVLGIALSRRTAGSRLRAAYLHCAAGVTLALVAVATLALTDHAAAGIGAGWAVPADFLHIAAVTAWLGTLALLPLLLLRPPKLLPPALREFQALSVGRFSFLASLAIGTVAVTGLFSAAIEGGSLHYLTSTAYGRTLLIKLALGVPVFVLGGFNALRLARRVADGKGARALARSAVVEAGFAAAVVAATAVLVLQVPAKDAAAQKQVRLQPSAATGAVYRNTVPASELQTTLVVSPNRPGENDFTVSLSGPGVDQVTRVQLRFQGADTGSGGSTVDATPVGGGQFQAQGANLTFAGRWSVTVNVRRNGFDDANGSFTVEVPGANAASQGPGRPGIWAFPAHGITEDQTLGLLLAAAGLLISRVAGRIRLAGWAARGRKAAVALTLSAGAMFFFAVHSHGGASGAASLTNPVPADQRSVDAGYALFQANCVQCHGTTGHGDGPLAAGLNPRPVDLTVHAGLHPDWQLFDWITNGLPPTAMPPFGSTLSEQQRWDLVNYLRTLSAATSTPAGRGAGAVSAAAPARGSR